jgi:hypothetical protein
MKSHKKKSIKKTPAKPCEVVKTREHNQVNDHYLIGDL